MTIDNPLNQLNVLSGEWETTITMLDTEGDDGAVYTLETFILGLPTANFFNMIWRPRSATIVSDPWKLLHSAHRGTAM